MLGQFPGGADLLFLYLINQNIAANHIIKEDKASNTYENLAYSLNITENHTKKETTAPTIAVVSSEYHLYRAKLWAKKLGYSVYTIAAPTSNWLSKINHFLRKAPVIVKTWLTS